MGQRPANKRKAGGGCAGDQTNAMLAVVQADDESLASPPAAKLALSVACPPPTEPADAGLRREPSLEVILPGRTPALLLRPQAAQHGVSLALRESLLAAPGNRPQIAAQRLDRVDRDDFSGALQIDTIGTIQLDHTLAVASANHCSNSVLP